MGTAEILVHIIFNSEEEAQKLDEIFSSGGHKVEISRSFDEALKKIAVQGGDVVFSSDDACNASGKQDKYEFVLAYLKKIRAYIPYANINHMCERQAPEAFLKACGELKIEVECNVADIDVTLKAGEEANFEVQPKKRRIKLILGITPADTGLKNTLELIDGIEIIGIANTRREFREQVALLGPDMALTVINLPHENDGNWIEIIRDGIPSSVFVYVVEKQDIDVNVAVIEILKEDGVVFISGEDLSAESLSRIIFEEDKAAGSESQENQQRKKKWWTNLSPVKLYKVVDFAVSSMGQSRKGEDGTVPEKIVEKVVYVETIKIEKVIVPVSFKKLILTIWGNPEFGCELAYVAAKYTELNVLLVDLDLFAPKAHKFLKVQRSPEGIEVKEKIFDSSGLDIIVSAIARNSFAPALFHEAAVKRKELKNLYVLTGNQRLENQGYYDDNTLLKLIERAYQNFDLTILLVNNSIFHSYTVIPLIKSDFNIIPVQADAHALEEYNNYIIFLRDRQHIPPDKNKFVAFEYKKGTNLDEKVLDIVTEQNYLGSVRTSSRREKYRNLKLLYARRMEDEVESDYNGMLSKLSIVPVPSLKDKLKRYLKRVLRFRNIRKIIPGYIRGVKDAVHKP